MVGRSEDVPWTFECLVGETSSPLNHWEMITPVISNVFSSPYEFLLFTTRDRKNDLEVGPLFMLMCVPPRIYIFQNTFESYFIYRCIGVLS